MTRADPSHARRGRPERGGELFADDHRAAVPVARAPADRRFAATAELRETVGSEAFVHFTLDAEPVVTDDTRELAVDTGTEMLQKLEEVASEHKTPFVARMHARSRAREGERVEMVVDTRELHFFDPETGAGIYA